MIRVNKVYKVHKVYKVLKVFGLLFTFSFITLQTFSSFAQSDSLLIGNVIKQVIETHPSVKQAQESINSAITRINLAKTGYYPNIDATGSYTRLGPKSGINFGPEFFQLYPLNNFNAAIGINENIYDFGKTQKNIDYENGNMELAKESVEQVKQKLSMLSTSTFYTLLYLQDAIIIKEEQVKTLNEHLAFIEKKKETGSATQYEILTTKVRISNVESQKTDLETVLQTQNAVMNTLLGNAKTQNLKVKKDLRITNNEQLTTNNDSLLNYAFSHRDEIKIAQEKSVIAGLEYKVIKSVNNPALNGFASGGWKNGIFPDMNSMTANFAAGVELSVPIFDAMRTKNKLLLAKSHIQSDDYETEIIRRNITQEVIENEANLNASRQKIDQYSLQLDQAKEALSLAEISFKSGAITNLDILDATTNLSESKLLLLKANIEYVLSTYKLRQAIGQRLY